jgi:hypothetical protein
MAKQYRIILKLVLMAAPSQIELGGPKSSYVGGLLEMLNARLGLSRRGQYPLGDPHTQNNGRQGEPIFELVIS